MDALDRHLLLMWEGSAELPLRPGQNRAGIRVNEQLGYVAVCKPLGIAIDNLYDVGWFSLDGDLARPGEGGAARLTRDQVGAAVDRHLLVAQMPDHAGRQNALDKDVLLQDDLFTGGGAPHVEKRPRPLPPFPPR